MEGKKEKGKQKKIRKKYRPSLGYTHTTRQSFRLANSGKYCVIHVGKGREGKEREGIL